MIINQVKPILYKNNIADDNEKGICAFLSKTKQNHHFYRSWHYSTVFASTHWHTPNAHRELELSKSFVFDNNNVHS